MQLDHDSCYRALLTHDARFDGAFFVGVSTTGIYCRTVCPAKTPRPSSCSFYPSAAAAERAGHRPCLRCRPELAPGNARVDAVGRLAAAAASRIEDGALSDLRVGELAEELGVSDRHLRRVIESEYGVSPIALAQTKRLLVAKQLLTETRMTVTDIAFASGFSSLRRFNALFKERYRLNPTDLRRGARTAAGETISCEIAFRPPLDWSALLAFLRERASVGVERVDDLAYMRTARFGKHSGWLSVSRSPARPTLTVEMSGSLAPAFLPIVARIKRLFDLTADPVRICEHLGPLACAHPGLRVPGAFDGFEIAVRAILGQQISVRGASTLASRFAARFGEPVETGVDGLDRLTPTAERVAGAIADEIASLGIIRSRAGSIVALAVAVAAKEIDLGPGSDVEKTISRLESLPGIGAWTAQYVAMRALGWPDAFPDTDLGIRKALAGDGLQDAESWRPWRAYAVMHLWQRLSDSTSERIRE